MSRLRQNLSVRIIHHTEGYVDLSNKYPYNAGLAKKLLKQAGADNMTLEFTVPPSYKTSADVIANYLRKVGIKGKNEKC